MSDRAHNLPMSRFSPAIAMLVALALLAAGVVAVYQGERSYDTQKANEVEVQARILASTVSAAVFFGDREAAQGYANALGGDPQLQSAAIYDEGGSLIAQFARGALAPARIPPIGEPRLEGGALTVAEPIFQNSSRLGTVVLRSSVESIGRRLLRYGMIALLTLMASLVVVVLAAAQRTLTKANAELAGRASQLESANRDLEIQISEREKAELALRQAQKMEAIGQLTGGVAHDFNNLLTVVIGNLDLVQAKLTDPDHIRRLTSAAIQAAERGARLVKQLLMFARRQPMRPENVNPNALLLEFEILMTRAVGANVRLVTQLNPAIGAVCIDRTQFEGAVLNLVVNAREAISGSGRIRVETCNVELAREDLPDDPDAAPGPYILVEVSDTGRGIPATELPRVFDPFFTTKGVGEGSGLGLSQVYGFAKESGGFVAIRSEVGAGTTVSLYLPRAAGAEAPAPSETAIAPATQSQSGAATVLVVEDEKIVLDMAVESLEGLGYQVLSAENGAQALEILNSNKPIDVLFSDVVMPGDLNGAQLAAAAASVRPELKVLLTSGYIAAALTEKHGLEQGTPFLQKPYRAQELAERLRAIAPAGGRAA